MAFSFNNVCRNVIPAGTYKVQISDIKFKEDASKTTQYNMEVHYVVSDGAYAKRTVIDTIYEKAFSFRLKPFLTAIGIDLHREFETTKELYDYGIRTAKGKFVMAEIGVRTYNGNEYNEIKTWAPLPSSTTTADDVMAEFDTSPDTLPKAPRIDDIPEAPSFDGDYAPIADVAADDLPF